MSTCPNNSPDDCIVISYKYKEVIKNITLELKVVIPAQDIWRILAVGNFIHHFFDGS